MTTMRHITAGSSDCKGGRVSRETPAWTPPVETSSALGAADATVYRPDGVSCEAAIGWTLQDDASIIVVSGANRSLVTKVKRKWPSMILER